RGAHHLVVGPAVPVEGVRLPAADLVQCPAVGGDLGPAYEAAHGQQRPPRTIGGSRHTPHSFDRWPSCPTFSADAPERNPERGRPGHGADVQPRETGPKVPRSSALYLRVRGGTSGPVGRSPAGHGAGPGRLGVTLPEIAGQ